MTREQGRIIGAMRARLATDRFEEIKRDLGIVDEFVSREDAGRWLNVLRREERAQARRQQAGQLIKGAAVDPP